MTVPSLRLRFTPNAPQLRVRVSPAIPPQDAEFRNNGTYIQWRVGALGTWTDLVPLNTITGPAADGDYGDIVVSALGSVYTIDPAVLTTFGRTIAGAADAAAGLTALGVSSFIRTLLDDASAPAARTTLGASGSGIMSNLGLACSVGSSALTVALKQIDGATDPTATAPVVVGMGSATAASGSYAERVASAALSLVVTSGATLGHTNAVAQTDYVYLIDNAGTLELAISGGFDFGESGIVTTTAMSAAADSQAVMYSTTARTNVAFRKIAEVTSTQATAGTWATTPSLIKLAPFGGAPQRGSNANGSYVKFADGTMICTQTLSVGNQTSWTYPAAFVSAAPWLAALTSDAAGTGFRLIAVDSATAPTITAAVFTRYKNDNTIASGNASLIAIGRWF